MKPKPADMAEFLIESAMVWNDMSVSRSSNASGVIRCILEFKIWLEMSERKKGGEIMQKNLLSGKKEKIDS